MKSIIIKILSSCLALLVLLSTLSFSVEKHFCRDYLVDISYFGNAKSCGDKTEKDTCDDEKEIKKTSCCSDETQHIQGQDELNTDFDKISIVKQQFIVAFIASKYFLLDIPVQELIVLKNYIPPKISLDIKVLFEVFIL